jgi:hypothetical protein
LQGSKRIEKRTHKWHHKPSDSFLKTNVTNQPSSPKMEYLIKDRP